MLDNTGRLLALTLYLPVLVLSPLVIRVIEARSRRLAVLFPLLCALLTPLLVVALALGPVRRLLPPSPDLSEWRRLILPAAWGGVIYGLALSRRSFRARLLVLALAVAITLAFISASSSWRSIREALPISSLIRVELEMLERKLVWVGLALLVVAAGAACQRARGRVGWISNGLEGIVLAIAVPILIHSPIFPARWETADIRRVYGARLEPNGDLIVEATWKRLVVQPGDNPSAATLVRHPGTTGWRCLYPGSLYPGSASPTNTDRILVQDERWWHLIFGEWNIVKILDLSSGAEETIRRADLRWATDPKWSQVRVEMALGPGRAWAVAEGNKLRGRLLSGDGFVRSLPQSAPLAWRVGSDLKLYFDANPLEAQRASPLLMTLDLGSGATSQLRLPKGCGFAGTSPNGQYVILAASHGRYLIDPRNRLSPIPAVHGQSSILVWREDGSPALVSLGKAASSVAQTLAGWESLREFRGKFFADATERGDSRRPMMIAILDHALTRITYVTTPYQSIQWLNDSIVFVEQARPYTENIVRYFPDSDRREELLSIPRPAEHSEP